MRGGWGRRRRPGQGQRWTELWGRGKESSFLAFGVNLVVTCWEIQESEMVMMGTLIEADQGVYKSSCEVF